jgi:hypothetical protein
MLQRINWRWLLIAAVIGLAAWAVWRREPREVQRPLDTPPETDPRLAFGTPYRNVHPDVQYVGDAACARCHAQQAHDYRQHPMGRSLAPAAEAEPVEQWTAEAGNPFHDPSGEYRYRIEQHDGLQRHHEERVGPDGNVLFETVHEAAYVIGSAQHGRSYLIDRDGWLFLSPITWYPQKQTWALSPGYEKRNQHFTRPIVTECLFCHANFADHMPETVNRYRPPIFRGTSIGCERCHGPGQLHVARREQGEASPGPLDETIVNPADLEPLLRDSICQQCHLGGDVRVPRRERDLYDYRPGLPWHLFAAVYVQAPHLREGAKITGHVEQMHESRCWQASQGKLGCISCHDPHYSPPVQERPSFYRRHCLTCHEAEACTSDTAAREATRPPDNCLHCHMPSIETQVRHAAITDHRIPRRGEVASASAEGQGLPLIHFHRELVDSRDPQARRDLGVALVRFGDEHPDRLPPSARNTAVSLLEAAITQQPNDWDALEALAHAVWWQGRQEQSLELFERALASRPRREFSLYSAASRAQQLGRFELAADYWRRTIEVNPWVQRPHQGLAISLGEQRKWPAAAAAARRALELFPGDGRSRQLLVESLLGVGDFSQADAEFELLLRLEPDKADALRRWYAAHPARPTGR